MQSKFSAALAASTLIVGAGLAASAAAPASAASETSAKASSANTACMTRPEYRAIRVGMPLTRVRAIVGSPGKNAMQSSIMSIWQWKVCTNPYGVATVTFLQGKVDNKSFIG